VTRRRLRIPGWPWFVIAGTLIFLYGPVLVTALFSFNDSNIAGFPVRGLTVRWYVNLWHDPQFRQSGLFSLKVAALSTLIAVAIGTPAAFAAARSRSVAMRVLSGFYVVPLLLPALVLAVSMAATFRLLNLRLTFWTVLVGHVVMSAPLIFLVVAARLRGFDWSLPAAARVLGASPPQAFLRVTAPLVAPAVLGGAILAFAISMDNFVISLFLTGGTSTLPLLIWSRMREFFDPTVNAMATLYIVMTLLAAVIAERVGGFRATRGAR
jgi:spermidine/putrescine transport system permease protein